MKKLVADFPSDPIYRSDLARSHSALAQSHLSQCRWKDASQEYREAVRVLDGLRKEFPSELCYGESTAERHGWLGFTLDRAAELEDAEQRFRIALRGLAPHQTFAAIVTRVYFAPLLMATGRYTEAERLLGEALKFAKKTASGSTENIDKFWLGEVLRTYGTLCLQMNRIEQAEKHFDRAIKLYDELAQDVPKTTWPWNFRGWVYHRLAEARIASDRLEEAEREARLSLRAWRSTSGSMSTYLAGLAQFRLGELLHLMSRTEEAADEFAQAQEAFEKTARNLPQEPFCHDRFIVLLTMCPDPKFRDPERAVELAKRTISESNGPMWRYLGLAKYRAGKWQDAMDSVKKSMRLRADGDALDWLLLCMAHWQVGEQEESLRWYRQAEAAIESEQPILYDWVGVLGFRRLRDEAKTLLESELEERQRDSQ